MALVVLTAQWSLMAVDRSDRWASDGCGSAWFFAMDRRPGFVRGVALRSWVFGALAFIPSVGGLAFLADLLHVFRRDRRCLHDLVAGTTVVGESGGFT